jgi:1-acyl-sn-glycerol-3-phosphate acyltransferase
VPKDGPVILAPNHFSAWDHFFTGAALRRRVRFMAKSQLFKPPMQFVFSHGGVFPVRRGHSDEEAFITAHTILAKGGAIVMYCEGGRSRSGGLGDRARPGIGRLALESGATVVPVAIHGSAGVRGWKRLRFPKVTIQYGEPLRFPVEEDAPRERHQEVSDQVFARVGEMYEALESEGRRAVARRARAHS